MQMTRSEWPIVTNPHVLLVHLGEQAGERKLRLLACAGARRIWPLLPDKRTRKAIEVAERYADGRVSAQKMTLAYEAAGNAVQEAAKQLDGQIAMVGYRAAHCATQTHRDAPVAARNTLGLVVNAQARRARESCTAGVDPSQAWQAAATAELTAQAQLVRDIFGNPFRPVPFSLAWRTETVVGGGPEDVQISKVLDDADAGRCAAGRRV